MKKKKTCFVLNYLHILYKYNILRQHNLQTLQHTDLQNHPKWGIKGKENLIYSTKPHIGICYFLAQFCGNFFLF